MYSKELLKGNTEVLLLSLLAKEPMYGYQIAKEMDRRSSGYFRFKEGTLYPALHRLAAAGLVEGKWGEAAGGQVRRYYYIAAKGKHFLQVKLEEWQRFSAAVNLVVLASER